MDSACQESGRSLKGLDNDSWSKIARSACVSPKSAATLDDSSFRSPCGDVINHSVSMLYTTLRNWNDTVSILDASIPICCACEIPQAHLCSHRVIWGLMAELTEYARVQLHSVNRFQKDTQNDSANVETQNSDCQSLKGYKDRYVALSIATQILEFLERMVSINRGMAKANSESEQRKTTMRELQTKRKQLVSEYTGLCARLQVQRTRFSELVEKNKETARKLEVYRRALDALDYSKDQTRDLWKLRSICKGVVSETRLMGDKLLSIMRDHSSIKNKIMGLSKVISESYEVSQGSGPGSGSNSKQDMNLSLMSSAQTSGTFVLSHIVRAEILRSHESIVEYTPISELRVETLSKEKHSSAPAALKSSASSDSIPVSPSGKHYEVVPTTSFCDLATTVINACVNSAVPIDDTMLFAHRIDPGTQSGFNANRSRRSLTSNSKSSSQSSGHERTMSPTRQSKSAVCATANELVNAKNLRAFLKAETAHLTTCEGNLKRIVEAMIEAASEREQTARTGDDLVSADKLCSLAKEIMGAKSAALWIVDKNQLNNSSYVWTTAASPSKEEEEERRREFRCIMPLNPDDFALWHCAISKDTVVTTNRVDGRLWHLCIPLKVEVVSTDADDPSPAADGTRTGLSSESMETLGSFANSNDSNEDSDGIPGNLAGLLARSKRSVIPHSASRDSPMGSVQAIFEITHEGPIPAVTEVYAWMFSRLLANSLGSILASNAARCAEFRMESVCSLTNSLNICGADIRSIALSLTSALKEAFNASGVAIYLVDFDETDEVHVTRLAHCTRKGTELTFNGEEVSYTHSPERPTNSVMSATLSTLRPVHSVIPVVSAIGQRTIDRNETWYSSKVDMPMPLDSETDASDRNHKNVAVLHSYPHLLHGSDVDFVVQWYVDGQTEPSAVDVGDCTELCWVGERTNNQHHFLGLGGPTAPRIIDPDAYPGVDNDGTKGKAKDAESDDAESEAHSIWKDRTAGEDNQTGEDTQTRRESAVSIADLRDELKPKFEHGSGIDSEHASAQPAQPVKPSLSRAFSMKDKHVELLCAPEVVVGYTPDGMISLDDSETRMRAKPRLGTVIDGVRLSKERVSVADSEPATRRNSKSVRLSDASDQLPKLEAADTSRIVGRGRTALAEKHGAIMERMLHLVGPFINRLHPINERRKGSRTVTDMPEEYELQFFKNITPMPYGDNGVYMPLTTNSRSMTRVQIPVLSDGVDDIPHRSSCHITPT